MSPARLKNDVSHDKIREILTANQAAVIARGKILGGAGEATV
jgi:hypothetical protein